VVEKVHVKIAGLAIIPLTRVLPFGIYGLGVHEMEDQTLTTILQTLAQLRRELRELSENMDARLTDVEEDLASVVEDVDKILKKVEENYP
jgi:hypothetical protein